MAQYDEENCTTVKYDKDGQPIRLANFSARIIEELKFVDGKKSATFYKISGWQAGKEDKDVQFPEVVVPAAQFASMGWVAEAWGIGAIVYPGSNVGADLATAIRIFSREEVVTRTIYTHTGWAVHDGQEVWLAANGAIGKHGLSQIAEVELPAELARYKMPSVKSSKTSNITEGILASLSIAEIGPAATMWPLLAAVYRSVIGPCDFSLHVTGRTGTYKSEIASLLQSHFGESMDARHLPGSWSSTANALEALAYRAKDALFVIDDFIPLGTSWQRQSYQKTADQLIRGQGNQAGRARLSDTISLQSTMYPRGLILSTGEDTPEGHSVRGRMMIVELSPGDISLSALTSAQNQRELYSAAMAGYLQWLANDGREDRLAAVKTQAKEVRDTNIDAGHSRTPDMMGQLVAGVSTFLEFAVAGEHLPIEAANKLWTVATDAIIEAGRNQEQYLASADPTETWMATLRGLIQAGKVHLRTKDGGVPLQPTTLGWVEQVATGDIPTYKASGQKIGWVDWDTDEILLDQGTAYELIKKHSRGGITLTKQTLYKRLRENGMIKKFDVNRGRSTIRATCEGASKQVLCLSLAEVLESQERV